jgi:hypothetical protein
MRAFLSGRAAGAVAGAAIALAAFATTGSQAVADVTSPCGSAAAAATLDSLDGQVATNIYRGELGGSETQVDLGHIRTAPDLLAALAAGNRAATLAAVKRIVYHPFWHIVRLRVMNAAGALVADFGGPYVIAPVSGTLRSAGRAVGSFVMSVQDDVGFMKLEEHTVGDPIAIYVGGRRVASSGATFPVSEPAAGGMLAVAGGEYGLTVLTYNAFPTGTLDAVIATPPPSAALEAQPCAAVSLGEVERVVKRIAARFHPLAARYYNFAETVHADTGAAVIVRLGARDIADSEGPGPPVLPASGTVAYLNRTWSVFSFEPTPPARVFVLVPQAV